MVSTRPLAFLAALAVACGLAACGGSDSGDAKSALNSYLTAFAKGDGKKACSLMTTQTRAQFVTRVKALTRTTDCAKSVGTLKPVMAAALRGANVTQVKVAGSEAAATVRAGKRESTTLLRKEGGKWKVSAGPGTQ